MWSYSAGIASSISCLAFTLLFQGQLHSSLFFFFVSCSRFVLLIQLKLHQRLFQIDR